MNSARIEEISVFQGVPPVFVERVRNTATGEYMKVADVESFSVEIFKLKTPTERDAVYSQGSLDPALAWFDTLQHGGAENLLGDSGGYNFFWLISADDYAFQGGFTYRVQIVSTVGNSQHVLVKHVKVLEMY